MATELYLEIVDGPDRGWLVGPGARRPGASGWDAQLLSDIVEGRALAGAAARVLVGDLPRDEGTASTGGMQPPALEVAAILGDSERTIDEALIERVVMAFDASGGSDWRSGSPVDVWKFLREHEGDRVRLVQRSSGAGPSGEVPARKPDATAISPEDANGVDASRGDEPAHVTHPPRVSEATIAADAVPAPVADAPAIKAPVHTVTAGPAAGAAPMTAVARWGAAADWLTLATLRAVVVGIVVLHLFVLIGEAFLATP